MAPGELNALKERIESLEDQNRKLITLNDGLIRTVNDLRTTNLQLKQEITQLNDELEWLENVQFRRHESLKGAKLRSGSGSFLTALMTFLKYLASFAAGVYIGIYVNQKHEIAPVPMPDVVEYRFRQFEEYLRARRDD